MRGQCQSRDTWLLLCWHWLCHVARAQPGSRETRGLGNIRRIIWCHHDQDSGGWLESEEDLTTISMSRGYIGDQEFTMIQEWRGRGVVFSTRHSNTSSSLQSIINTSKHAIVYTTSHGALNFGRNTVIELFKCPPVDVYSLSLSGNLIFIITKPNWISIDGRGQRVAARWAWAQHHQPGNSPNWDNSRVKITVQIVSNPYFSCAHLTSIAINLPPYPAAGKCVVWSKQ